MATGAIKYQAALRDFQEARLQASLQEVVARLTGKSNRLFSYEEIAQKLRLGAGSELGLKSIPVDAIVGSVGRYTDFTRTFLPRRAVDPQRWARIKAKFLAGDGGNLPPIQVYKVGEVFFVLDGNHRVSIARRAGIRFIDAEVIEIHTPIHLTREMRPDDLILQAEYADFADRTCLHDLRPGADLALTAPGQYVKLYAQIELHRQAMEQAQRQPVHFQDAAADWYDTVYWPLALLIRERGLLRWFPGRTEADLYMWTCEHRETLEKELGWAVREDAAVTDLMVRESPEAESRENLTGSWRKARMLDRYTDRLFADILVPIDGEEGSWGALEQALAVARREQSQLHGLHIVRSDKDRSAPQALAVQERFNAECETAGVPGSLAIEAGPLVDKVCERALLADLVVIQVARPPAAGLPNLSSNVRSLIWRVARPLLALPCEVSRLERALLLFDGSPKAKEALFVAAYLAEKWKIGLVVLTLLDGTRSTGAALEYARRYLDIHEVQAEFLLESGPFEIVYRTQEQYRTDLSLLGGYSVSALQELVGGSAVNFMLRDSCAPLLICR